MSARERIKLRLKRVVRHMRPSHMYAKHITRRLIRSFAEKVGLVYFGFVDQRDDDHRLIRGHTVSATHQDHHYCIGTVRGYDVMLVSRNDVVRCGRSGKGQRCHWLILTVDLHTKADLPHCYVGHRNRDAAFKSSHQPIYPLAIGGLRPYPHHFLSDYTVYGSAAHTLEIERMVTPQMAEVIAAHFSSASFEVVNGVVYLYIESERPTEALLEKMLANVLWVAESIDANAALPVVE